MTRVARTKANLLQAAIYVPSQVNNLSFVKGFTPAQWVTGRSTQDVQSLSGDLFVPGINLSGETTFEEVQERRIRAQKCFIAADTDARLRRAMNKNFRENRQEVAVGQKCWYWRVAGAGILRKAKWRGPARVVTIEKNDDGRPIVMWLVHGTSLIRCSPYQVRPLVEETGYAKAADPQAALDDLKDLRARSTTQFKDVTEEPDLEDQVELESLPGGNEDNNPPEFDMDGYSPDSPADEQEDQEMVPIPGAASLLFQQMNHGRARHDSDADTERSRTPRRKPEDSPDLPSGMVPMVPEESLPPSAGEVDANMMPVPADDDELIVDDVMFVGRLSDELPRGWSYTDQGLVLDEQFLMTGYEEDVYAAAQTDRTAKAKAKAKLAARREASFRNMTVEERLKMIEAKKKELKSFFDNRVWEFTGLDDVNTGRTVTARWVLTWKEGDNNGPPVAKARLVLRGFEDPDLGNLDTNSPTATRQSRLLLLGIAPTMGWSLVIGDVKAAFLSGAEFERKIIVKLPADCNPLAGCKQSRWTCSHEIVEVCLRTCRCSTSMVEGSRSTSQRTWLDTSPT